MEKILKVQTISYTKRKKKIIIEEYLWIKNTCKAIDKILYVISRLLQDCMCQISITNSSVSNINHQMTWYTYRNQLKQILIGEEQSQPTAVITALIPRRTPYTRCGHAPLCPRYGYTIRAGETAIPGHSRGSET